MGKITHRTLELGGIKIHIAEQGSGPLVVFVHGFPSLWFSWRYQIPVVAEAGFHAVAVDLRGYGQSDIPADESKYTMLHYAGDIIALIEALGEKQAFLVGHDWGSTVVSNVSLFRPDLVRGLVNLSVPFIPRQPHVDKLSALCSKFGDGMYMNRWQEQTNASESAVRGLVQTSVNGEAEADFAKHGIKTALAKLYCHHRPEVWVAKEGKTVLDGLDLPDPLPSWLTDEDLQYFADSFQKTGMTGGFNMYRNIRRTWELTAPWSNQGTKVPALFVTGDQDLCMSLAPGYATSDVYRQILPNLKDVIILPGVGHFLAEEAPEQVNPHLLKFLKEN